MKTVITEALLTVFIVISASIVIRAQTTEFTYQGSLKDNASPANANYDFEFALFDALSGGSQIGAAIPKNAVLVANGIFAVKLDFGSVFPGANRYLEVRVKLTGQPSLTPLLPRQLINSAPYSVKSLNADIATTATNAIQLGGVAANQYVLTGDTRLSDARNPLPNSTSYIQNQNAGTQTFSNFNISGTGTASILNATTQFNLGGSRVLSAAGTNNLIAGIGAGNSLNTGSFNAFFGNAAGGSNTTGALNAFFGAGAGQANFGGDSNAFFGSFAGNANTNGLRNAIFGADAGLINTTGLDNAFFGEQAGNSNTTGNGNAFFGKIAGDNNSSGQNNTFIGRGTNFNTSNTTGNNDTLLGASSRVTSGISNATAIGFKAQVEQDNSLILGGINGINSAIADTKVGIGTTAPGAVLDVQHEGSSIPQAALFTTYSSPNEILGRASSGTRASPTGTLNGTTLLSLSATGHNGNGFVSAARAGIVMDAAQDWAPSATGTQIRFRTTPNDSTTIATRMIVTNDGNVGIGTSAPASKLEVNGSLTVDGAVRRPSTGSANMVPICYGSITQSGVINGGTGNFTVSHPNTGVYEITISGESYDADTYPTIVTTRPAGVGNLHAIGEYGGAPGGKLVVLTNSTGTPEDHAFSFVVYKP